MTTKGNADIVKEAAVNKRISRYLQDVGQRLNKEEDVSIAQKIDIDIVDIDSKPQAKRIHFEL